MSKLVIKDTLTVVTTEYEPIVLSAPASAVEPGFYELSYSAVRTSGDYKQTTFYGYRLRNDGKTRRRGYVDTLEWIKDERQIEEEFAKRDALIAQLKSDAGITEGSEQ